MVILINSFEVPAGREKEFLDGWHAIGRHLATQPGYVRTRFHRALSPGTTFSFVNVGEWASPPASRQPRAARGSSGSPRPCGTSPPTLACTRSSTTTRTRSHHIGLDRCPSRVHRVLQGPHADDEREDDPRSGRRGELLLLLGVEPATEPPKPDGVGHDV
jgi:hypothetical protein